jgi:hypothetical protein
MMLVGIGLCNQLLQVQACFLLFEIFEQLTIGWSTQKWTKNAKSIMYFGISRNASPWPKMVTQHNNLLKYLVYHFNFLIPEIPWD